MNFKVCISLPGRRLWELCSILHGAEENKGGQHLTAHELRRVSCMTSLLVAEESGSFLSLGSAPRSSGETDSDTRGEAVTILTSPLALLCQTVCVGVCVCVLSVGTTRHSLGDFVVRDT